MTRFRTALIFILGAVWTVVSVLPLVTLYQLGLWKP